LVASESGASVEFRWTPSCLSAWGALHIPYRHTLSRTVAPRLSGFPRQCLCTTHSAHCRCSPVRIRSLRIFCNPSGGVHYLPVPYRNSEDKALSFVLPQTSQGVSQGDAGLTVKPLTDVLDSACCPASRCSRSSPKHTHLPDFNWCVDIERQLAHHKVLRHPSCFMLLAPSSCCTYVTMQRHLWIALPTLKKKNRPLRVGFTIDSPLPK